MLERPARCPGLLPLVILSLFMTRQLPLAADTIVLKSGAKLEGKIVTEQPDEVTIKTASGAMTLPRSQIKQIKRGPAPSTPAEAPSPDRPGAPAAAPAPSPGAPSAAAPPAAAGESGLDMAVVATIAAHAFEIEALAFSPDGRLVASAGGDRNSEGKLEYTIKLWDWANAKEAATLKGPEKRTVSLSFSPDGALLASGSHDGNVTLWDVAQHKEVATLSGHRSEVQAVAFSSNGRLLASGGWDDVVKLWDVETRKEAGAIEKTGCFAIAFSANGEVLATAGVNDKRVRLWGADSRNEIKSYRGHPDGVVTLAFSPNGKWVASGARDSTLKVWDTEAAEADDAAHTIKHPSWVQSVAFSSDGTLLAAGSSNQVKLWDPATGREKGTLDCLGSVNAVAFAPGALRLAAAGKGGLIKVWERESADRKPAMTWVERGTLKPADGSRVGRVLAFSPDGRRLAAGEGFGGETLRVWDVAARRELTSWKPHAKGLTAVAFFPDGKRIVSANKQEVKIWEADSGKKIATLEGAEAPIVFSPDGSRLITGGADKTVKLWDPSTLRETAVWKDFKDRPSALVFVLEGKSLAVCIQDFSEQVVQLWDVDAGAMTGEFRTGSFLDRPVVSPDGKLMATGGINLVDLTSRRVVSTLPGHKDGTLSMCFLPDGTTLASAGRDKSVKLWNVRTQRLLATLTGFSNWVEVVCVSPDGKLLVAGSDTELKVWERQ